MNSTTSNSIEGMSRLRSALFPLHNWELRKYFPMAILVFCVLFNFTLLRNFKDTLIVANGAAETLSALKFFVVMPLTLILTMLYLKMRGKVTYEQTFYRMLSIFMIFFIAFMILFPYTTNDMQGNYLHWTAEQIAEAKQNGGAFGFMMPIVGLWLYSLFYCAAELWGTFALSILFWQFANDTITSKDSKRFYPLLILAGNIAVVLIGALLFFSTPSKNVLSSSATDASVVVQKHSEDQTLIETKTSNIANRAGIVPVTKEPDNNSHQDKLILIGCGIIVSLIIVMMLTFNWLNKKVLSDPRYLPADKKIKKAKLKLTLGQSLKKVFSSNYIGYIAVLVLSYGILVNVVEVTWKSQLKQYSSLISILDRSKDGSTTLKIIDRAQMKKENVAFPEDMATILKKNSKLSRFVKETTWAELLENHSKYGIDFKEATGNVDAYPDLNDFITEGNIRTVLLDKEIEKNNPEYAQLVKEIVSKEAKSKEKDKDGNFIELAPQKKIEIFAREYTQSKYLHVMGLYTLVTGFLSIILIYSSKGIIRVAGWAICASITPIMLIGTGILFFAFNIFSSTMSGTILLISVFAGGFGILATKSAKYSFFDPTKEMAFIPLDHDERTAGKAAADGVGGRLGKSGGGAIQALLLTLVPGHTQGDILPYLAVVLVILGLAWLYSVGALSKLYNALIIRREEEAKEAGVEA